MRYNIEYVLDSLASPVKQVNIEAKNKWDAYDLAVYEKIPEIEGSTPYSAWVASVTYKNGTIKQFNTFDGKPV